MSALSSGPARFSELGDALTLLGEMTADRIRQRFDVKWELRNDGVLVMLTPKDPAEARRISRLDFLLDLDTWKVLAQRTLDPAGRETVHTFDQFKFDVRPEDRDMLLLPDLTGYRPLKWPGDELSPEH